MTGHQRKVAQVVSKKLSDPCGTGQFPAFFVFTLVAGIAVRAESTRHNSPPVEGNNTLSNREILPHIP